MELLEKHYDAFLKSQSFLLNNGITNYPFDIKKIILKNRILLMPLSEYQDFRKSTNSQEDHINISDGRVYFEPLRKIYLIIYTINVAGSVWLRPEGMAELVNASMQID